MLLLLPLLILGLPYYHLHFTLRRYCERSKLTARLYSCAVERAMQRIDARRKDRRCKIIVPIF